MTVLANDTAVDAASRRGPMRPRRLVSARANRSKRLASHVFRAVDVAVLVVLTVVAAASVDPIRGTLDTTVGTVLPMVVGARVLARALRSLSLYRFARHERWAVHVARVLLAGIVAVGVTIVVDWLVGRHGPQLTTAAAWVAVATAAMLVTHTVWWWRVHRWRTTGWLIPNVVVVGATEHAEALIAEALHRRHVNVVGVFDDRLARAPAAVLGVPVLGDVDALLTHRITPFVDLIVVAVDPEATRRVREIAARLAILPNEVTLVVQPDGSAARATAIERLDESPLAPLTGGAADLERKAFAKRLQDLLIGVPMLVLLAPVLAVVAVLIKLDSRGPVFFRQRRHGFNNEEIVVWKFRTMRTEATDARAEQQVTANDQRVTRIGRLLRSTSLDEVPQLLNVVRGEMSLVGPRPHAIGMKTGEVESALLVAEYAHRHRMKPGMTGWAAIHGSRGPLHDAADVQRRVALDVEYIARQSFWLDVWIMLMTVPSVFGDRHTVR
ncbi:MAG: exopolysaccharide biosynthesis polyprenyl glycosylphosphotransferase [Ilumatobacteraceae bacterium]